MRARVSSGKYEYISIKGEERGGEKGGVEKWGRDEGGREGGRAHQRNGPLPPLSVSRGVVVSVRMAAMLIGGAIA